MPGPGYWQIYPRYDLRARLNPEEATVHGSGSIAVGNTSPEPWTEVVLRLDQNRFRRGTSDGVSTGGVTLSSLAIDGVDLPLSDGRVRGLESTVVTIALGRRVDPGQVVTLELSWSYEIPLDESGLALRQGRWGTSVFQMGQWYPRLAMFDDIIGWDTTAHDGSVEFYSPFASFHTSLIVPEGWLVGATGVLQNEAEVVPPRMRERLVEAGLRDTTLVVGRAQSGAGYTGRLEWRFVADSVRDFAWGASADYSWVVTSRSTSSGSRLLVHALATERHQEALRSATIVAADALTRFSELFGPYPASQHWLVDGPEGGMEYPGMTMSHGDGRTAHEIAHQWFPMTVGSDETRFGFLDEGLASFLPSTLQSGPLGRVENEQPALAPLIEPSDLRTARPVLGYGRARRMLGRLAATFGDRAVIDALKDYAVAWRFKHPTPWDFMFSIERSLGANLDPFWLAWLFSDTAIPR